MMPVLRLVALMLALCAGGAQAAAVDAPFLWKVQGPKAVHYLMGSVHLLPASAYPLPPALDAAYAQTRALVLETDPGSLETPQMQTQMLQAGLSAGGLGKEIDAALYARVREQAQKSELPTSACDRFKAWLCGLTLTLVEFQRSGMNPELGLDLHFHHRAQADGRAVSWLETPESQLAVFAGMTAAMSAEFLASSLDDLSEPGWRPESMVDMWRDNDTAKLGGLIDDTRKEFPDTYARLLGDRNRAWVDTLVEKLNGATPQLVVVGAGHLVGKGSVVELLKARGFAAEAMAAP
ncbi:hypothetical protein DFR24_3014 [Panacagrimonas perspica]|uniref:TraB family protein n=1 Tax=Panacagrimonas perspica TaxID=381431 RepID=A0A4S3K9Y8_9GAMM|nr:hypothetical protein DFR24_3014 [Panacagrimonas perspica]THD04968.1 hypothetical protein B1810_03210 [Panacagrimonas perspica]